MPYQDYLFIVAEVSIVLAGFAAVVLTFGQGNPSSGFVSRSVVLRGLLCSAACFLPSLLHSLIQDIGLIWRTSSVLLAAFYVRIMWVGHDWWRSTGRLDPTNMAFDYWSRQAISVVIALALFANAYWAHSFPYLLGVTWMFLVTGLLFASFINLVVEDRKGAQASADRR